MCGSLRNLHYGIIHSNTNEILLAVNLPFINNCSIPKKYTKAIPGDLFLADTSEDRKDCGKGIEINGLSNHEVVGGLHTIHIRDKQSLFVPFYKALFTRSNAFHKFAYKYSEGVKVFSLKPSLFKYLDFYYPEKLEQQKIVDLFEYIDTKIALLEQKIEALKKYRKGIINSWFENIGKTVKLCELVKQQTSQLLTHQIKDNIGTYPVYDATGNIYKSIDFYANANDSIAIIKYGSGCGRTFIARNKHCVLGTMSELIPLNHSDLTYIFAFTESTKFKKACKKYIEVGTTPNLYYSDYSTELVYYPDERNNFVDLIDLIRKKCVYLETEKEKLNLLKRQLLKDMFI